MATNTLTQYVTSNSVRSYCIAVINDRVQFPVTQAQAQKMTYGAAGTISCSIPLDLMDDATLDDLWNKDLQTVSLYMGSSSGVGTTDLVLAGKGIADSVGVHYSQSDGELLYISGPDMLGIFAEKMISPQNYLNSKSSDIALQWALDAGLIPHVTATLLPISNYYQQDTSYLSGSSQSQLDMLNFLAGIEGFAFWTEGSDFYFGLAPSPLSTFDARYKVPGYANTIYDIDITRHPKGNKNIQVVVSSYDPKHKSSVVVGQIKGQQGPLRSSGGAVIVGTGSATTSGIQTNSSGAIVLGTAASSTPVSVTVGSKTPDITYRITIPAGMSQKQANGIAKAKLHRLLLAEVTLSASLPGNTSLLRNQPVQVDSSYIRSQAGGLYYISDMTHSYDITSGFITTVDCTNYPFGSVDDSNPSDYQSLYPTTG